MGEYDISQWRLAGTEIHTPSDPKMAKGVRTSFRMPHFCGSVGGIGIEETQPGTGIGV